MTRPSEIPARRRGRGWGAATALAILFLAGCGTATPSGSSPTRSISAAPTSAASSSAPSSPGSASGSAVAADPTLLDLVPRGGITLTYDPDTTASVAAEPTLAISATGLAIGFATAAAGPSPPSAGPGGDLAVVSVIRLRDPSVDEAWFRDWRDSYDDAACANAGGVTRHAESVVGQTTVFVGSCAGGSFTYHARVDGGAAVISLTSIGPANLGKLIMEGLAR